MEDGFFGVHWMLATPFHEDEGLDVSSIPGLVEKAREVGCRGVVALGVTGEAARLTDQERTTVSEKVMAAADGLPAPSSPLPAARKQRAWGPSL